MPVRAGGAGKCGAGTEPRACWIKTEDVKPSNGRGALINVHELESAATKALTGTTDWTRVEVEFDIEDQSTLQINCLLGGRRRP